MVAILVQKGGLYLSRPKSRKKKAMVDTQGRYWTDDVQMAFRYSSGEEAAQAAMNCGGRVITWAVGQKRPLNIQNGGLTK